MPDTRDSLFTRVIALGAAALTLACAARTPPSPPIARELALETFDAAWRIVHETHFDTTFNGVDWRAVRSQLRPTVESVATRAELRDILQDMVGRLAQSHFAIIAQETADALDPADSTTPDRAGDLGLDVRYLAGRVVVSHVERDGPAALAGVRPGWIVQRIDGAAVAERVARLERQESRLPLSRRVRGGVLRSLAGAAGQSVSIDFLDGRDRPVARRLTRRRGQGEPVKLGNLPTFFASLRSWRDTAGGREFGGVWFSNWMVPLVRRFDGAMDEFRELDGIVIDLRGNPGGVGAMVAGVAGHFFTERTTLGEMRTRSTTLRIVANPRRVSTQGALVAPYDGPVAILVDETTGSASEMFAGGMQAVGRARVFGETTAGAVLPASMDRLPNGDILYHAFAEFISPTGTRLEGRGVVPDEVVPITREALIAGLDPVADAAARWIADQSSGATEAPQRERRAP